MKRIYTVKGTWPFPLDMLRHDEARAASPQEQHLIDRMSGEFSDDGFGTRVPVSIILVMEAGEPHPGRPNGRFLPNHTRWQSFGWEVIGVPEIDDERELLAVEAREQRIKAAGPMLLGVLRAILDLSERNPSDFYDEALDLATRAVAEIDKGKST